MLKKYYRIMPLNGEWHGLRGAITASLRSLHSLAECRAPRALAGAIKADGISRETDSEADDEDRP